MTSYKRCDSLPNCEANFTKRSYPIYYNVIPCLLGLNVGKTKKSEFRAQFFQADGSLIPCKKAPNRVPFCMEQFRVLSPPDLLLAMDELPDLPGGPQGLERLLSTRGSPA